MKKILQKAFDVIITPIVALIVHIGTSIEINEDSSWDKHHERKNRKGV
jgi:hypothetical protein